MGAAVVVELGEEVGGVVGLHPRDQVGDLVVVAVFGELELVLVAELFEEVGFELGVVLDGGDDLLALAVRCGLDEVGQLGRVEAGELRVRDAQLDGRDVAGERLEARPVEEVGDADRAARPRAGSRRRSRLCGLTSIPTTRHQPSTRAISISFARTRRAPSTLISCRSSRSSRSSSSPSRRSNGCRSSRALRERDAAVLDLADLLGRNEDQPSGDLRDGAADRRVVVLAEADDEVVDPAELAAVGVGQLAARDEREVEDGRGAARHGSR